MELYLTFQEETDIVDVWASIIQLHLLGLFDTSHQLMCHVDLHLTGIPVPAQDFWYRTILQWECIVKATFIECYKISYSVDSLMNCILNDGSSGKGGGGGGTSPLWISKVFKEKYFGTKKKHHKKKKRETAILLEGYVYTRSLPNQFTPSPPFILYLLNPLENFLDPRLHIISFF